MTTHEKITRLMEWIARKETADGELFKCQTIRAQRAVVPLESENSDDSDFIVKPDGRDAAGGSGIVSLA